MQKMQKAWRRFYQERLCGTDRRLSWLRMTGRWQIMPTEYFYGKYCGVHEMIAFDGMGVYNENVQQYIVNNGYAINA